MIIGVRNPTLIDARDHQGRTALWYAAFNGQWDDSLIQPTNQSINPQTLVTVTARPLL